MKNMTVGELIERLSAFDPETPVYHRNSSEWGEDEMGVAWVGEDRNGRVVISYYDESD